MLRNDAPKVRTAEAIVQKHEQILDGLERSAITPKAAEQMGQQVKGILAVERLAMQYLSLALKYGRTAPVPRTPVLRSMLGLPEKLSPTDGETIRALVPQK